MRRFLRRKLAGLHECKSGNATLMTALGLPALLGATGYGVDTAQWYMWQRELQHSVDQAAIGGAWALAYDEESTEYTTRAQQEYYANQEKTASFDSAPSIRLADFEGGEDNSVVVTASVTRRLPFTGLLLNRATTVTARAQAAFEEGAKYNACLITLKEDGTTFQVGGNAGSAIGPLLAAWIIVPHGQKSIVVFSGLALLGVLVLWQVGKWQGSNLHRIHRKPKATGNAITPVVGRRRVVIALSVLVALVFSK